MKKITLELTEEEMHNLAEMAAFALTMQGLAKPEKPHSEEAQWRKLSSLIMNSAHAVPSIGKHMEMHPELRHWFFKHDYAEKAYYTALTDDVRDSFFWSELVQRMADHTLAHTMSPEEFDRLSEEERNIRVSSLEHALWTEVTQNGIDRLIFMLSEEEC